jgi:hypothetical protein
MGTDGVSADGEDLDFAMILLPMAPENVWV